MFWMSTRIPQSSMKYRWIHVRVSTNSNSPLVISTIDSFSALVLCLSLHSVMFMRSEGCSCKPRCLTCIDLQQPLLPLLSFLLLVFGLLFRSPCSPLLLLCLPPLRVLLQRLLEGGREGNRERHDIEMLKIRQTQRQPHSCLTHIAKRTFVHQGAHDHRQAQTERKRWCSI